VDVDAGRGEVVAVVLAVADEGNKEPMASEVTLAPSGMVGRIIVDENAGYP
jgi:hypothetical protein